MFIFRLMISLCVVTVKGFHVVMFRKHCPQTAAAPLFSLCLKHLFEAPVSLRPQSALIGQLIHSVVIGQQDDISRRKWRLLSFDLLR